MIERVLYEGHRRSECGGQEVTIRFKPQGLCVPLDPNRSQDLRNHSPDGFNWGYLGSGPAQLALALLLDTTNDEKISLQHYQDFKFIIVANWKDDWSMSQTDILEWLDTREPKNLEESLCQN